MNQFETALKNRFELSDYALPVFVQLTDAQRRTLAASRMIMRSHRAVLLYEPTGTGKTFVACALAKCIQNDEGIPCIIVAPAHLISQWRRVAEQFDIRCMFYSYQSASMGKIPEQPGESLWLIDEAHYLKNPATKRYQAIYRRTFAHRICLITATPVSMKYQDLYALSILCGYPKTLALLNEAMVSAFCQAIMPQSYVSALGIDKQLYKQTMNDCYRITPEDDLLEQFLEEIYDIRWLTTDESGTCQTADIIYQVLMNRLLSHRCACLHTLNRLYEYYRNGCVYNSLISRSQFCHILGLEGTQRVLPFDNYSYGKILRPDETEVLKSIQNHVARAKSMMMEMCRTKDGKVEMIERYLTQMQSSDRVIMFTQYADTAYHFATHLNTDAPIALVTANTAWYNKHRIDSDVVMDMFDPDKTLPEWWYRTGFDAARILICTDVLSCGHNFHRANRLIHLDYPWNPTVMQQREGRIMRRGQAAEEVQILLPRLYHPPKLLSDYESHILRRLSDRFALQQTWTDCPPLAADAYVLVTDKNVPGLWAKVGDVFIPIAPGCMQNDRQSEVRQCPVSVCFSAALRSVPHRSLWHRLKQHPHLATPLLVRQLLAVILDAALLPKHYAACYPKDAETECSCFSEMFTSIHPDDFEIPNPDVMPRAYMNSRVRCFYIRNYPQTHGSASQSIHKLSTG